MSDPPAEQTIRDLLHQRDPGKTICPSEAARQLDPDNWRDRMDDIYDAARRMIDRHEIEASQKGEPVDIDSAKGPIRLRLKDDR